MFGAGGGTSSYREIEETDVVLLWGSNARETHPIFFHHLLKGVRNGARLYAVDPRRTTSAQWADLWLGLDVGTDIALANAMGREIIAAGLANDEFIGRATSGFEAYRAAVEPWTLERAERVTGVPAAAIRETAHAYATAGQAMICWTLGITEHHNAVDNVLALINLSLLCGHVGRWGSGLNPLRGQNNVQGGGDMGALPDRLPGFQHVENDELRAAFDRAWGVTIPPTRGLNLTAMYDAMERGDLTAVYCIGENPAQSEADTHRARRLLEGLELLVVQDIFLTATARDGGRGAAGGRRLGRDRGHRHQLRAPRPAGAARPRPARRGPRRPVDHLRDRAPDGPRLGRGIGRGRVERAAHAVPGPRRDELCAPRGRGRAPVALLRRDPPRRAVPPLAAVGGSGAGHRGRRSWRWSTRGRSTSSPPSSRCA